MTASVRNHNIRSTTGRKAWGADRRHWRRWVPAAFVLAGAYVARRLSVGDGR